MAFPLQSDRSERCGSEGIKCEDEVAAQVHEKRREFDYYESTDYVRLQLEAALEMVGEMPVSCALSDVDVNPLIDVSVKILRADKSLRKAVEFRINKDENYASDAVLVPVPSEICTVFRPENALVAIRLPAVLQGSRGEWYSKNRAAKQGGAVALLDKAIYRLIKDALTEDVCRNGPVAVSSETLFLVFLRYLPTDISPRCARYVDNNNVECGYITNALCEVIKKGDNYLNLNFVYLAVPCESEPCVDVILCESKQLQYWIRPFQSDV